MNNKSLINLAMIRMLYWKGSLKLLEGALDAKSRSPGFQRISLKVGWQRGSPQQPLVLEDPTNNKEKKQSKLNQRNPKKKICWSCRKSWWTILAVDWSIHGVFKIQKEFWNPNSMKKNLLRVGRLGSLLDLGKTSEKGLVEDLGLLRNCFLGRGLELG